MTPGPASIPKSCFLSIGIFAWNEEEGIASTLDSLFRQSLFRELPDLGLHCEVVIVANGCSDLTAEVAEGSLARQGRQHCRPEGFEGRVARIPRPGKVNAWNEYVHSISAGGARYLFMMDADILIHRADTLWNMVKTLERHAEASVVVDRPCKDLKFKNRKSLREGLSLAASQMTSAAEAQLCGQLYGIRSEAARSIYLPRDLAACEDGILKALVCTDNLAHEVWPSRIRLADGAEHTFKAYTSPAAVLRNQKRQIIGQTMVHLLIDQEIPALPSGQRQNLAATLRERDESDPNWFRRVVERHVRQARYFWRLYPGQLSQGFRRLRKLEMARRMWCLPTAVAWWGLTLIASWLAYRTLKSGCVAYWPKVKRASADFTDPVSLSLPFEKSQACGGK